MSDFGMPTLIELNGIEECAKLCCDLGLSFIELNMNMPEYQLDRINIAEFIRIAQKYGIYYTIHLDENLNFCDFNPYVSEAYFKTVIETVKLAKALNAPVINMHLSSGVYFTLPHKRIYLFEQYFEQYLDGFKKFIKICEDIIGKADIKICIENCDGFREFHKSALELFFKSPLFALTYDIGHDCGIDGKDGEYILGHKDKLCHMHLHDAVGKKHHLALGDGELNINKYLSLAESNNCSIVIETKTVESLKRSVEWLNTNT